MFTCSDFILMRYKKDSFESSLSVRAVWSETRKWIKKRSMLNLCHLSKLLKCDFIQFNWNENSFIIFHKNKFIWFLNIKKKRINHHYCYHFVGNSIWSFCFLNELILSRYSWSLIFSWLDWSSAITEFLFEIWLYLFISNELKGK